MYTYIYIYVKKIEYLRKDDKDLMFVRFLKYPCLSTPGVHIHIYIIYTYLYIYII